MEKKRFIFDLDGTLLTGDFRLERDYFEKVYGNSATIFVDNIPKYLDEYENGFEKYDITLLSKYLSKKSGLPVTEEIVEGWIDIPWSSLDKEEVGIKDTLEYLKNQGKRLENSGLYSYFDDIYTGDTYLKPHKESYLYAKGEYTPQECLVIGDSLERDYIGPRATGIDSILYDKDDKHHKSIVKIKKMKELMKKY